MVGIEGEDAASVRLLAVRDEDPQREWDALGPWWPEQYPGVIGIRDRRAGGAWLAVDPQRRRLAVLLNADGTERQFRITPETAAVVRQQGLTIAELDQWSLDRSGEPLAPSARLLLAGADGPAGEMRKVLVLTLPSEAVTDGVCQWPETGDLLDDRLGPRTVTVAEENADELLSRLAAIGVEVRRE